MELIVRTLGNAAGLWLATSLLAGLSVPQGGSTAAMWINLVVLGLVLALVNSLIKPVARLVALPLYILTFGLFALVVNPAMLKGWMDRVFIYGEVYASQKRFEKGRFAGKRAMLSLTGWLTDNLDALGAGGSVPLGLEVSSFGAAVAGSLIVSVISALIVTLLGPRED